MWLLPAGARRAAVAFLLAAFFATLAITPGDAARPASQPQNAFVVGAILDLASGWTSLGRASRVTLQLAEADANAAPSAAGGTPTRSTPRRRRQGRAGNRAPPAQAASQGSSPNCGGSAEEQRSRRRAARGDEPRGPRDQPRKHGPFACGGIGQCLPVRAR